MYNNVVEAIVQAYREKDYCTLRINFRGVGCSQGEYDSGVGEQGDVREALGYLFSLGKKRIDLAGYSFGAWVNARGLETFEEAGRLVMVSPPVDFIDFSFLSFNTKIKLVIVGTHDDLAGCGSVEKMMPTWNPEARFRIIHGADHFYRGKINELKASIDEFLEDK